MKFWQALTWIEPEQLLEAAKFAEEVGFEGVFLGDHGVYPQQVTARYPYSTDGLPPMAPEDPYPDCWVTLGALSAATSTLKFSVSVYVLPLRNVFEVARATGSLDLFSDGRFLFGVGAGWMEDEFDIYGVPFRQRGKRMDEMITILRKLWQGGWVEHQGEYYDFPALQVSPAPGRQVPVLVGGGNKAALRRAARNDGWLGAGSAPEEVPAVLQEIAQYRAEYQRQDQPFETIVGLTTPPDVDTFKRLEAAGMTAGVSYPFKFALGARSSLDEKKRLMEQFAESIIRHCR
ncbi:TIGR03619 family F420-dependent LLM class oxidoreductase [Pseudohalioglobus sediminis]|uniref:TIGR03619 family F420-dependent LLM class oxidoreductase n=1 Tax=Pseudohalioglobus sediminis TaxID=2606449 RepID=A0A5B0X464_9GAMM|nr:TIGR03619 family F420-dependent LLM class oxidoreductase [Pseudohalioglobus sediminis]KAA1193051.1 TIGR03619 family F420-dependent LLM class oxidoreductase [Pseudohalioglobus sediminis]